MSASTSHEKHFSADPQKAAFQFAELLRDRRSRRFGLGMEMPSGPLKFKSDHEGIPLGETEEALLAFAACGVTGHALADLAYEHGQGGTMMAGFLGRTIPSGDALHGVSLIVMNQDATYYMKRPQDFESHEIDELATLAQKEEYVELYRRSRIKIRSGRRNPINDAPYNLNINRWALYDPKATYFLPINEITLLYINGLLELFNETTRYFVVDEKAGFRPAGIARFGESKGGHLKDNPKDLSTLTIQQVESNVSEFVMLEMGLMIQNLGLMSHAIGLGGYPHFAGHPFSWFEAIGFRMGKMPASQYLGMNRVLKTLARLSRKDFLVPYPVGLEVDGEPVLHPYCPPYYESMEAAVHAVVDLKFGPHGVFRGGVSNSAWKDPQGVADVSQKHSQETIEATVAYCEYVYRRYGRFPVHQNAFRTGLGFQVNHLDLEFYEKYYHPTALTALQREHFECWHAD